MPADAPAAAFAPYRTGFAGAGRAGDGEGAEGIQVQARSGAADAAGAGDRADPRIRADIGISQCRHAQRGLQVQDAAQRPGAPATHRMRGLRRSQQMARRQRRPSAAAAARPAELCRPRWRQVARRSAYRRAERNPLSRRAQPIASRAVRRYRGQDVRHADLRGRADAPRQDHAVCDERAACLQPAAGARSGQPAEGPRSQRDGPIGAAADIASAVPQRRSRRTIAQRSGHQLRRAAGRNRFAAIAAQAAGRHAIVEIAPVPARCRRIRRAAAGAALRARCPTTIRRPTSSHG